MINAVIDLSHHNRIDDFGQVKDDGILAVIHKATQGTTYVDPTWMTNKTRMKDADLFIGAYHFGIAGNATAQAEHFADIAFEDDVLLVLDLEGNPQGHDMSLLEAEEFVHQVATITGSYPGLYSGHTLKEILQEAGIKDAAQTELSKCWLWIAQYAKAPLIPKIWDNWTLWQYTDGAAGDGPYEVAGIGRCDRDQFNGSADELTALWSPISRSTSNGGARTS